MSKPRRMPPQRPGKSVQAVGTPRALLRAVKRRLGIRDFDVDLAANRHNYVCDTWYGPGSPAVDHRDSLASWVRWQPRMCDGWSWLNPPFADIWPWLRKAKRESSRYGARIAVLVPLSIAEWWVDHVHDDCVILLLVGRVTFRGHAKPYPKDCVILLYGSGLPAGYYLWKWRGERHAK